MFQADSDLFDEPRIPGGSNGGSRPNAGRKKGTKTASTQGDYEKYAKARAEKEVALALREGLKFELESGAVVPRDDVRRAAATAFAIISQTLRAIPDNLERRLGIQAELAEEIGRQIDDAMGVLSDDLEKMCNMGLPNA